MKAYRTELHVRNNSIYKMRKNLFCLCECFDAASANRALLTYAVFHDAYTSAVFLPMLSLINYEVICPVLRIP